MNLLDLLNIKKKPSEEDYFKRNRNKKVAATVLEPTMEEIKQEEAGL